MIRTLLRKLRGWRDLRVHEGKLREAQISRSQALQAVQDATERHLGQIQMRLAQAHADYTAAKHIWPRDRKAVDQAWRRFRDARCEQISAELRQEFSSSRELSQTVGGVR